MLARKYRGTKAGIEATIKKGQTLSGDSLYAKALTGDSPQFAIIVSKKVEKTSVGRHLIKRKISGVLENELTKISPDFKKTVVFFVKQSEGGVNFTKIKKDLLEIMKKAGFFA